jgi:hypothetical protein
MPVPTLFDRSIRVTRACSLQGPRSFALIVATFSNVSALSIGNGWRRYPRCHHLIIAIRRLPWPTDAPREARPVSNWYVLGVASQFAEGCMGQIRAAARCTLPRRTTLAPQLPGRQSSFPSFPLPLAAFDRRDRGHGPLVNPIPISRAGCRYHFQTSELEGRHGGRPLELTPSLLINSTCP